MFGDLLEYPGTYGLLHTRAFFFNVAGKPWSYPMYSPVAYPPFAAMLMAPIYLSGEPELMFLLLSAAWLVAAVLWVRRWMIDAGLGRMTATLFPSSLVLMSFPIARMVHQGNIELLVWVLTATGTYAWVKNKNGLAAVLWGCAAAAKLFPLALLALLLPRRRWRAFLLGLATFVAVTLFSLWWLGPTIGDAWRGSVRNVFGYQAVRGNEMSLGELLTSHSAIEIPKLAALVLGFPLNKVSPVYYAVGAVAFALAFFGRLWRMPPTNQLLGVSTFLMMFPAISYYHALVHMYAALVLLGWVAIRAERAGVKVRGLRTTVLLFVPLFTAFTVLSYPSLFVYCGLLQSCALMLLFLCSLDYRLEVPDSAAA